MYRRTVFALTASLFALGALAHDHEGTKEVTVMEVDPEERQITALLPDGSTNEYVLAEDAEITTFDGVREREHDIHALRPGLIVELELDGDGDDASVRSINMRSED